MKLIFLSMLFINAYAWSQASAFTAPKASVNALQAGNMNAASAAVSAASSAQVNVNFGSAKGTSGTNPIAKPQQTPISRITFAQAMAGNEDNKDQPEEVKKPEIIIKKFNNETFYHYSFSDKFLDNVINSSIELDNIDSLEKQYLKTVTSSFEFQNIPSLLEERIKNEFTREEMKQVKETLNSPFIQKFLQKMTEVEDLVKTNTNSIKSYQIEPKFRNRNELISHLANTVEMVNLTTHIKAQYQKNLVTYSSIVNGKKFPAQKEQLKQKAKEVVSKRVNYKVFNAFYNKALFMLYSKYKHSELMEAKRLLINPLMIRFFRARSSIVFEKLAKYPSILKNKLYLSANLTSYKK